jgi:hypothetical protein
MAIIQDPGARPGEARIAAIHGAALGSPDIATARRAMTSFSAPMRSGSAWLSSGSIRRRSWLRLIGAQSPSRAGLAEKLGGELVQAACLFDRFSGELREQQVAPVEEVVDVAREGVAL